MSVSAQHIHRSFVTAVLLSLLLVACRPVTPGATTNASSSKASSLSFSSAATVSSSHEETTPAKVLLDVPFSSQAPFAVWDAAHEETCEEMSLIMAMHYVKGDRSLTSSQAEQELQDLLMWEKNHQYSEDVSITELSVIAQKYYGLAPTVIDNVTEGSIKKQLAKRIPVIIPAAGRTLGNPYFSGEGPWYHMLVIIGYREGLFGTVFITNDPGTKRGAKYEYASDVLLNAIHDWTGVKEEIEQGDKRALTVVIQD
jgi:hypothetical protein